MRFAMPRLTNSLGLKVLGAYLAGVVLSIMLIAAGLLTLLSFRSELLGWRVQEQARTVAARVTFDASGTPVGLGTSDEGLDWIFRSLKEELAFRILDAKGKPVLHSPAGAMFWPREGEPVRQFASGEFIFQHEGSDVHVATYPLVHAGQTWLVQYAGSARMADLFQIQFALPLVGKAILLFSFILLVVFGACSYLVLRRTFRPLREISAAATAISPRLLHGRLPAEGVPAEVVPLVESFNRTLERLERGYRLQRDFLSSAAHELKTPLSLIRAQVELNDDDPNKSALLQDVEHMSRQVQQLLLLAEASEVRNYNCAPVSVVSLLNEVVNYLQRMADIAEVRLEVRMANNQHPTWIADHNAFFTLVKNLVENAIQHSSTKGLVSIEADADSVWVRDHGEGATDEQIARMFDRFWRSARRRDTGAGLGLSICKEVAEAHGWTVRAQRASPGLRFEVSRSLLRRD